MQHMFDYILELIKDRVFLRIKEKIYKEIWLLWQHNSNFSWHQDSQLFFWATWQTFWNKESYIVVITYQNTQLSSRIKVNMATPIFGFPFVKKHTRANDSCTLKLSELAMYNSSTLKLIQLAAFAELNDPFSFLFTYRGCPRRSSSWFLFSLSGSGPALSVKELNEWTSN